jgi:hypothetical protein
LDFARRRIFGEALREFRWGWIALQAASGAEFWRFPQCRHSAVLRSSVGSVGFRWARDDFSATYGSNLTELAPSSAIERLYRESPPTL